MANSLTVYDLWFHEDLLNIIKLRSRNMVENINICISHKAAHFKNSQQITIIILYSIFAVLMTVQKMRKSLVLFIWKWKCTKTYKKYIILLNGRTKNSLEINKEHSTIQNHYSYSWTKQGRGLRISTTTENKSKYDHIMSV